MGARQYDPRNIDGRFRDGNHNALNVLSHVNARLQSYHATLCSERSTPNLGAVLDLSEATIHADAHFVKPGWSRSLHVF